MKLKLPRQTDRQADCSESLPLDPDNYDPPPSYQSLMPRPTLGQLMSYLPSELVSSIFIWCTPTVSDKHVSSSAATFSITLSHVCREWRAVVLSTPRLWEYTKVTIYRRDSFSASEIMKLYLVRSRMRPVFIDIDFCDIWTFYDSPLDIFNELIEIARQYRPEYTAADSFLATHLEASSSRGQPTLQEWYFWSARPSQTTLPLYSPPGKRAFPSITEHEENGLQLGSKWLPSVTLRAFRMTIGYFTIEPYIGWSNSLTFLIIKDLHHFTNVSLSGAALVLSFFPLLIHCSLHIDIADHVNFSISEVKMQYLRTFVLSWSGHINVGSLVDAIYAPDLRELELSGKLPGRNPEQSWDHLLDFMHRNHLQLTHLILEHIDCFRVSLPECLRLSPSLLGLWLENCILDNGIINDLYRPATARILVKLDTLVIIACSNFSLETLVSVLGQYNEDASRGLCNGLWVYLDGSADAVQRLVDLGALNLQSIEIMLVNR